MVCVVHSAHSCCYCDVLIYLNSNKSEELVREEWRLSLCEKSNAALQWGRPLAPGMSDSLCGNVLLEKPLYCILCSFILHKTVMFCSCIATFPNQDVPDDFDGSLSPGRLSLKRLQESRNASYMHKYYYDHLKDPYPIFSRFLSFFTWGPLMTLTFLSLSLSLRNISKLFVSLCL